MKSPPWPEMTSTRRAETPIRRVLDYLVWISREMRQLGFHSGSERDEWCRRCEAAYRALFVPMLTGCGDPYPPDVPPARNPGIWPDIPAATIPGMTLRHQLTVIEMIGRQLRDRPWPHARAEEVDEWDRRLDLARQALDHGEGLPMPDDEASEPSQAALEQAEATEKALKDRQRRRSRQLRQQFELSRTARKKTAKKKTAKKKTAKKKTAKKTTATKAPKKKTAKKTTATKAPKKKTAKKKTAKKKTAKKKTAKKRTGRRK